VTAADKFVRGARVKAKPATVERLPAVAPVVEEVAAPAPAAPSKRAQRREQRATERDTWFRQHEAGVSRERFWIVWSPTERRPSMRHESAARALDAAERLSRANPAKEFLVFECVLIGGEGPR
jgi:hypothetical protein